MIPWSEIRCYLTLRNLLRTAAFTPIIVAFTLVQITEPFPRGWLSSVNPHFWPNVIRALTFGFAGVVLGMITYTLLRSIGAERTVSGGHPRKRLYQHVTVISVAHGFLIATLLFYIRERVNNDLSPATPVALVGLIGTFAALALMLSYQNSRLRTFHAAKQVIGIIERAPENGNDLLLKVMGSTEAMPLREWLHEFEGGVLCRMSIEKVEEMPVTEKGQRRFQKWLGRHEGEM